jgi:hypothetical protein
MSGARVVTHDEIGEDAVTIRFAIWTARQLVGREEPLTSTPVRWLRDLLRLVQTADLTPQYAVRIVNGPAAPSTG